MWRDTAHTDKTEQDAKNKCDTSGVLSTAFVLEASAFPHTDLKKKNHMILPSGNMENIGGRLLFA